MIWEEITLDKLGTIAKGVQKHKPEYDTILFENGNIPLLDLVSIKTRRLYAKDADKFYNDFGLKQSKLFEEKVLIFPKIGRFDAVVTRNPSCICHRLFVFIPNRKISDVLFIKYCFDFSKIKRFFQQISSSGTLKFLTKERISKIKFPNPPFELQEKIGKILSTYDLLIENYEKQIERAKEQVFSKMIHTS